ncbi:MAG TPA: sugar transferase, partial [Dehalococcoidia bacterium]|nr:sugar transferase [Dehalococcoidia bacterium]
ELVAELDQAIPFYRLRHSVRPGLAGWAVIKHGYSSSLEDARIKLEYDLYYIKHQSIWFDLVILLKAFVDSATFRGRF